MNKIITIIGILIINYSIFSTEIIHTGNIIPNFTQHKSYGEFSLFSLSLTWDGPGSLNNIFFNESLEKLLKDTHSNISDIETLGIYSNISVNIPIIPKQIKTGVIMNITSFSYNYTQDMDVSGLALQPGINLTYNFYYRNNVTAGLTSGFIYERNNVELEHDLSSVLEIERDLLKMNYNLNIDTFTIPTLIGVKLQPFSFLGITISTGGNFNYQLFNDSIEIEGFDSNSLLYKAIANSLKDTKQEIKYNEIDLFKAYTSATIGITFKNFGLELHSIYWADTGNITISTNYVIKI